MIKYLALGLVVASFALSCKKKDEVVFTIPADKLVSILVDLYVAKAAANQNDPDYRDSTTLAYLEQISAIHGYSAEQIQSDLKIMYQNRDTLIALQSRALDTLRAWNEKQYQSQFQNPLSTGTINN